MTMHSVDWSRLSFIQLVNNVLSVITFAISLVVWTLFGFGYAVLAFLILSLVIATGYRIAFNFSTVYAYYLWVRYSRGRMAEYVARQMGIIREVEVPNLSSGVARAFGLTNASLAEAGEVNVGLTN